MRSAQFPGSFFGPTTLVDLARHRANHLRDQTAYIYLSDGETAERPLTYYELDRQARAIAAWLTSLGLEGENALLLYPTGIEFIAAFFGCLYAGVVAVPVYPPRANRSLGRIQAIAQDAGARVALTTTEVLDRVRPVLSQMPDLEGLHWLATDHFPEGMEEEWRPNDSISVETLAFLQYTSGSTGTPKGVMLTHGNLLHNSALISHAYEHTRSGGGVFWLPSHHDMGLIGGILQPMYGALPNVLMSPMSFLQKPARWLQAIARYKASTSGGPNFAYDLCIRKITPEQRAGLDLSCWTVAFNGAEPVRAETLARFVEAFEPCGFRAEAFYPCYGLAEATLIVSGGYKSATPVIRHVDAAALSERGEAVPAASEEEGARALVGSGETLPDQEIAIVDPQTLEVCPDRKVGEVWVTGPSVAQGYWNRPVESEQTFRATLGDPPLGSYLRTGDLGYLDEGELFITGRLKDLIIVRGLNHYPQDIELTVERCHPALRPGCGAAFTLGQHDDSRLTIVQEVERRQEDNAPAIFEAIRKAVNAEHELVVQAIALIKSGSVPKTSSGKIQRHACREGLASGMLEIVAEWRSSGEEQAMTGAAPVERRPRSRAPEADFESPLAAASPSLESNGAGEPAPVPRTGTVRVARHEDTAETVLALLHRVAGDRAADMTIDSTLSDLGLDSLERLEVVAALEERFGARFPEDVPGGLESVKQIVEAVDHYLASAPDASALAAQLAEIPPESHRFDKLPEYARLRESLEMLDSTGLGNPFFQAHQGLTSDTTTIDGRELINFSSFNYIGMSGDARVAQASKEAIDRYGTSVSASRLVSGEKVIHRELERALAELLGVEDAMVFSAGHGTNESTIGHLFGPGDLILHDALAHNSIAQGCKLSGAKFRAFRHNDWRSVDQLLADLRPAYRRALIAIEGAYSMDGDLPDLPKFVEIKKKYKAFLYIDEAHSVGVLGASGRGLSEHFGIEPADVDIWMGTLSKALGSCGGYIAGAAALIEYLKYTAPGFVFATGISPSNAAAALAAIQIMLREPERLVRLHENSRLFLALAKERGLDTGRSEGTPIVPIIIGNSIKALILSRAMFRRGVNVQPILYPAVDEKASRLRFFITSRHTSEQIRFTVETLAEEYATLDAQWQDNGEQAQPAVQAGSSS